MERIDVRYFLWAISQSDHVKYKSIKAFLIEAVTELIGKTCRSINDYTQLRDEYIATEGENPDGYDVALECDKDNLKVLLSQLEVLSEDHH